MISGLRKIAAAYAEAGPGHSYFSDGAELRLESYSGRRKVYHCGREYRPYRPVFAPPTLLVVIDTNEAAIGESDGENINVLWYGTSGIMGKHTKGGQSAARFARAREEAKKHWVRKVADQVSQLANGRPVKLGGSFFMREALMKEVDVVASESTQYADENGLWELERVSRYGE